MRILVTTSTFPVVPSDGSPRFVFDLAQALTAHGSVTVLAPHAPGAAGKEVWGGVAIQRFRYFRPARLQRLAYGAGMRENMRRGWLARMQVPFLLLAQAISVGRLVRTERIDVVNSHWMVPQGLTAAWARGRRARFRHVLHVHAADVYLLAKLPLGGRIARYVLNRTDQVLADGSHVRDALDRLVGRSSHAVLQPMGAWLEEFRAPVSAPPSPFPGGHLAFVGRLVEKKGVVYLLRALALVRRRHPDLGLLVMGSGPLQAELEAEAQRLQLTEAVVFMGTVSHDELVRQLRGSRLAVVPSIIDSKGETEGMPTVVVEMMAAGLPVVGTDVNGIPDLIEHGRNGWLARPADEEDLASQIDAALAADTIGILSAADETVARFDWPRIADRYAEYLGLGSA